MLDGLDEADPDDVDRYILPWLRDLCKKFPKSAYVVSSRPVGYRTGLLYILNFAECGILDFGPEQINDYTRHWCVALRLARNEPEEEARREGATEGEKIVAGFQGHPYIENLAQNPLMLSAICLVNYFEGGRLPDDRAVLYRLCVEGLLHHWDQRRGILSEFALDEKLRVCREVALAMQAGDRAECPDDEVRQIFEAALGDRRRAQDLLEHIRYRTGLLIERRPRVFAFAHLTFQEYLAARAVHEGNQLGIDSNRLVDEHEDARWREVIALYCGLAPAPAARGVIDGLIAAPDTKALADVLADAFLSSGSELTGEEDLRRQVLRRIAVTESNWPPALSRFLDEDVAPVANEHVGTERIFPHLIQAHRWLMGNLEHMDERILLDRLVSQLGMNAVEKSELVHLLHLGGSDRVLEKLAGMPTLYEAPGPTYPKPRDSYSCQAEIALIGMCQRYEHSNDDSTLPSRAEAAILAQIFSVLASAKRILTTAVASELARFPAPIWADQFDGAAAAEFAASVRAIAKRVRVKGDAKWRDDDLKAARKRLSAFADALEKRASSGKQGTRRGAGGKTRRRGSTKRPNK